MSAEYPFSLIVVVGILWFGTTVEARRFARAFTKRYPAESSSRIPYAFSWFAHPEKTFFIFRKWCRNLLEQNTEMRRWRRRVVTLYWVSMVAPMVGFGILAVFAVRGSMEKRRGLPPQEQHL